MMERRSAFLMVMVAGSACTAAIAASQDQPGRNPVRYGGTVGATHMIVQGQVIPLSTKTGGVDVPQVVYDNGIAVPPVGTPTTGAFATTSEPNEHLMDVVSFNPGPGAGSGVLLTSTVFNIAIGGTVATLPNDAIAVRYRIWDTITLTATPVTSDLRGDITLIFAAPVAGWAGGFYYVTEPIDLTTLPGGGIQTSDDLVGVDLFYLTTMIDPITQQPVATTTPHPDATAVFADFSGTVTLSVGSSEITYWRDVNGNGEFSNDEIRGFATPAVANFVMSLTGEVGGSPGPTCYANCDGSTAIPFLNVNDFVCFQQRFAAGDSYANCDNSTAQPVLNVNDFVCFQQSFAAGCSAP